MPRKPRDGSREIDLHNDTLKDKNIKYRNINFANHMVKYSRLLAGLWIEVITYCGTVLFYDYGFKSVHGLSRLDRNWRARMEHPYETDGNNHPLCAWHKRAKDIPTYVMLKIRAKFSSYFDTPREPILVRCWVLDDLTPYMNNKTGADGIALDGNKSKFNSNTVYNWLRLQDGKDTSPQEKLMLMSEMKLEHY